MAGRDIDRLHDELEQLFDELWHLPRFGRLQRGFRPRVDVFRTEEPPELTVVVDLAAVDPDEVHIVVFERTLVIAGERQRLHPECRLSYHQLEIEYGPFQRRVGLPDIVDAEGARASYERGLLTIVLPVTAKPAPQDRVSISVQRRR